MAGTPDQVQSLATTDVVFYTRRGCTLCDKIWPSVEEFCRRLSLSLISRDVDADADLRRMHGDWVPVISIGGRVRLRGRVSSEWLWRELSAYAATRDANLSAQLKKMRVGVSIVYDSANRILVNKRPVGSYYEGWWEWPGGKCEMGETPIACTIRELTEEIGIRGHDWRLFDRRKVSYPGRSIDLWFFLGAYDESSYPRQDALEHMWIPARDIHRLRFLEPNIPVLNKLLEIPQFAG